MSGLTGSDRQEKVAVAREMLLRPATSSRLMSSRKTTLQVISPVVGRIHVTRALARFGQRLPKPTPIAFGRVESSASTDAMRPGARR